MTPLPGKRDLSATVRRYLEFSCCPKSLPASPQGWIVMLQQLRAAKGDSCVLLIRLFHFVRSTAFRRKFSLRHHETSAPFPAKAGTTSGSGTVQLKGESVRLSVRFVDVQLEHSIAVFCQDGIPRSKAISRHNNLRFVRFSFLRLRLSWLTRLGESSCGRLIARLSP